MRIRSLLASLVFLTIIVAFAFPQSRSKEYISLQQRLARGWNTWDTNSMTTHVLLPEGLAIHLGFKHNATVFGDEFLERTSVGSGTVFPGTHAWDGSYTQLKVSWRGHEWRVESAHAGSVLGLLVTPLEPKERFAIPAPAVFKVDCPQDIREATLIGCGGDNCRSAVHIWLRS